MFAFPVLMFISVLHFIMQRYYSHLAPHLSLKCLCTFPFYESLCIAYVAFFPLRVLACVFE